jgi:hypothetical protein
MVASIESGLTTPCSLPVEQDVPINRALVPILALVMVVEQFLELDFNWKIWSSFSSTLLVFMEVDVL